MTDPIGFQVTFDATDPHALARFWAEALGYEVELHDDFIRAALDSGVPADFVIEVGGHLFWRTATAIRPPGATDEEARRGRRLLFQAVPEPKPGKNRLHLDLNVSGGPNTPAEERRRRIDEEVVRVQGLGATVLRPMEAWGEYWVVMQDPEGNEFCVQ